MININISVKLLNNAYLEFETKEIKLFEIDNYPVYIKGNKEKISESENLIFYSNGFSQNEDYIKYAKEIFNNILMELIRCKIPFRLDPYGYGNLDLYDNNCCEIHRNIQIIDSNNETENIGVELNALRSGCTRFRINRVRNINMNKPLEKAIIIKNFNAFISSTDHLNNYVENTLNRAIVEKLMNKGGEKDISEVEILKEVDEFLESRYKETNNEMYEKIKKDLNYYKMKSKNERAVDLIRKYGTRSENGKYETKVMNNINANRGIEIHEYSESEIISEWPDQIIFDILLKYSEDENNFR